MKNNSSFFQNKDCEYFPCHKMQEGLNCLFCYCPLYLMGEDCGGNFTYTAEGVKDCSNCTLPHSEEGYNYIVKKCPAIIEKMKEKKR